MLLFNLITPLVLPCLEAIKLQIVIEMEPGIEVPVFRGPPQLTADGDLTAPFSAPLLSMKQPERSSSPPFP